jgi:RNA polymerase sigma-70 factor, ECF subfamily
MMGTFENLYRQHASAVFRFAWGLCGDRSHAEDLVSETFVRLLTRAPEIQTETALAYLLAIARNAFLSGLRRRRPEAPLEDDLRAPDWDPVGELDGRERMNAIAAALRSIPEAERAALLLRVDHELSYEEIARALAITVGAARVRVHRARLRLAAAGKGKGEQHEAGCHA